MSGDDDLALFFGPNRERLSRLHAASVRPFCWPGLLFPQAWFLYRKMYGWAALAAAWPIVADRIPYLGWTAWGVLGLGASGLRFYFRAAERIVAEIRADPDSDARARIAKAGGVSRFGAAAGAVFTFAAFVATLKAGAH